MTSTLDKEGGRTMRPTPAQDRVVNVVNAYPGIIQVQLCAEVGPNGSNAYGHRAVLRTMAAGKIRRETRRNPANGQDSHYYYPVEVS